MRTHTIYQRDQAVNAGLWAAAAAAWDVDEYIGDSGVVVQAGIGAGNAGTYLQISGNLLDDGVIPSTADLISIAFAADYVVTAPAGNTGVISTPFDASGSVAWSGNSSGSLARDLDVAGLTWADFLGLGAFLYWSLQRDNAAQAGGNMRIVVTNFSATVTYAGEAPTLDGLAPETGDVAGGDTVQITGTALDAASGVTFGGVAAAWNLIDATTIEVVTPPHAAGPVDVVVTDVGTLAGAFTYTYALSATLTAEATGPRLPPIPSEAVPIDLFRWLGVAKQRIENLLPSGAALVADLVLQGSPSVAWDAVLKDGSSLADLETRSATDLSSGTLPAGRMPALTGDVTTTIGTVATTLATVNANVGTFGSSAKTVTATVNAKGLVTAIAEQDIAAAALTRTDDTNVTATLTGTPATALLKAVNVALGWTGTLAPARGGVGADVSGVAKGGLIVGTAAGTFGLKAVGTDGQVLTADAASTGGVKWGTGLGTSINASAYRGTDQTLTHNSEAAISFSATDFDAGMWAIGNPTRLTAPETAAYLLLGCVKFAAGFQGVAHLRLYKNGALVTEETSQAGDTATAEYHRVSSILSLTAADYVELKVLLELPAGSGTYDAVGGTGNTFLQAAKLAPQAGTAHALLDGVQNSDTTAAAPAKGALITSDGTTWKRETVGTDTYVLTADSAQTNGVKWAAPASGGGGLVLLESHTASASSTLDFTTRNASGQSGATFQSDYDEYVIEAVNLIPTTNGVQAQIRCSTDGGATFDSGANYQWAISIQTPAGGTGFTAVASATGATVIAPAGTNNIANTAAGGGIRLSARIFDPLSASAHKAIIGEGTFRNSGDSNHYRINFGGYYISATAVNALRVLLSSGTLASGTVRIYGVAK